MPSWDYIRVSTPWSAQGLHNKCREIYGISLHEHLRKQGFGINSQNYYTTSHDPTIESIKYYIKSLEDRKGWSDTTITSVRSAIKKATVVIADLNIEKELLTLGKHDTDQEKLENIQNMISVIEKMNEELTDDTTSNYTHYLEEYYPTVGNNYLINHNPVQEALKEFTFNRTTSNPNPVTEKELDCLWTTLNAIADSPYERYDIEDWRLWMKVLLVFMIAVGPRASEIVSVDTRTDLKFGEDPRVVYHDRKNLGKNAGEVKVPIMFGEDFLRLVVEYLQDINVNGALIPSPQSDSGCRCASTINNWLKRLCELSNMEFERVITIQNFRQLWKNRYRKALHENRKYIKFVTEEDKKQDFLSDEHDYIDDVLNRRMVRELGRSYFDNLIDIDTIPDLIDQKVDPDDQFGTYADLTNY